MKTLRKIIETPKVKCKILEFPIKTSTEARKEIKIPSMGCCKTSMMDWNFLR